MARRMVPIRYTHCRIHSFQYHSALKTKYIHMHKYYKGKYFLQYLLILLFRPYEFCRYNEHACFSLGDSASSSISARSYGMATEVGVIFRESSILDFHSTYRLMYILHTMTEFFSGTSLKEHLTAKTTSIIIKVQNVKPVLPVPRGLPKI